MKSRWMPYLRNTTSVAGTLAAGAMASTSAHSSANSAVRYTASRTFESARIGCIVCHEARQYGVQVAVTERIDAGEQRSVTLPRRQETRRLGSRADPIDQ